MSILVKPDNIFQGVPKGGILTEKDMYTPYVKIENKPLNPDFAKLHKLLQCPTCRFCDVAKMFRGPCCINKDRPHFSESGHDAIRDGKCPSHEKRTQKHQEITERVYGEVYEYGKQI